MIKIAFDTNAVKIYVFVQTFKWGVYYNSRDRIAHGGLLFLATIQNSGEEELFDPSQIFCSPSIKYCELLQYAKQSVYSKAGKRHLVQIAFQVRVFVFYKKEIAIIFLFSLLTDVVDLNSTLFYGKWKEFVYT